MFCLCHMQFTYRQSEHFLKGTHKRAGVEKAYFLTYVHNLETTTYSSSLGLRKTYHHRVPALQRKQLA